MSTGDQFILWGSSGHAKVLADVIALRGGSVIALFDNDPDAESCLKGVPLHRGATGYEGFLASRGVRAGIAAAVAIGGARSRDRLQIADTLTADGFSLPVLVHPDSTIAVTAVIGDGSQVLARAVIAAEAQIGRGCIINNMANVDHECHIGDGVHIAPGAILCGCVVIEREAFVGAGSVVLPRLRIGRGAIVGAGAVVTKDVLPWSVVQGNPARSIKNL